MILKSLAVGMLQANCYIIGCAETRLGAVIDPGGEAERILAEVQQQNLQIRYVINTHGHFDHSTANAELLKQLAARQRERPLFAIHPDDVPLLSKSLWGGFPNLGRSSTVPTVDVPLVDGAEIEIGNVQLKVLHTPGHSPGSVSLLNEAEQVLFSGDTLFREGVGRADLPGGDSRVLVDSIVRKLFVLPDETIVYSGHGPETTIGYEKRHNPFVGTDRIGRIL